MTDEEIAAQLLQYLRETNQTGSLAYLEGPTRIRGGFESSIFGLQLSAAPDSLSGPLVLRLFDDFHPPERARLEATVHNTLVKLGYPTPRVFVTGTDKKVLGGAFLLMDRIGGHTLAADFEGLGQGRSVGELVRFLMRVPKIFRKMSRTMAAAQFSLHELPAEPLARAMEAEGLSVNAVTFGGRLEWLTRETEHAGLGGLRAGAIWLLKHRPAQTTPPAICHCDFQPFNILAQDGQVTGVLDWANVTLAGREMDLGSTIANMVNVPVQVPRMLEGTFSLFINALARVYYRDYRRLRALDDATVRYHQVFRSVCQLVRVAEGVFWGRTNLGIYGSAPGISHLISHVRSLTGINLNIDISAAERHRRERSTG